MDDVPKAQDDLDLQEVVSQNWRLTSENNALRRKNSQLDRDLTSKEYWYSWSHSEIGRLQDEIRRLATQESRSRLAWLAGYLFSLIVMALAMVSIWATSMSFSDKMLSTSGAVAAEGIITSLVICFTPSRR